MRWKWKRGEYGVELTSPSGRHWFNLVWINDWPQWLPGGRQRYNWRTFHFAHLYVEDDAMTAGWDLDAILLGVGFHLRYTDQLMFETTDVAAAYYEAKGQWEPMSE